MLGRGLFKSAGFPSCVIRAFSEARPKEPEAIAAARRRADANFKLPRVSSVPIVTEYQGLSLRKQRSELNIARIPVHAASKSQQQQRPQARSDAPAQAEDMLQAAGKLAGQDTQSSTALGNRNRMRIYRKGDAHPANMRPSDRETRPSPKKKRSAPPSRYSARKETAFTPQLTNSEPLSASEAPEDLELIDELTKSITERLNFNTPTTTSDDQRGATPPTELRARDINSLLGEKSFMAIPEELHQVSRIQPVVERPGYNANPIPSAEQQVRAIRKARRAFGLDPSPHQNANIPAPQESEHLKPEIEQKLTETPSLSHAQIHLSTMPGALRYKRERIGGDYKSVLNFASSSRPVLDTVTRSLAGNGSIPPKDRTETIRVVERLTLSS